MVGVLGAAGVMTAAALAGGVGTHNTTTKTGHGDHHNTGRDTTTAASETSETPPVATTTTATPPPVDPLAAPVSAPTSAVTPQAKAAALKNVHEMVAGVAVLCGYSFQAWGEFLGGVMCEAFMAVVVDQWNIYKDPPDPNFAQVALRSPTLVGSIVLRCPKRVTLRDCSALRSAALRFRNALSVSAAAATGAAITLNRFSGASQAKSVAGALLQAAAEKVYVGELASALAAQQSAERAFASAVRKARLDVRMDARSVQATVKKLGSPTGVRSSIVSALVGAGVTSGGAELSQTLKIVLQGVPRTLTLSSALSTGRSTLALTALYRTLTPKDLAVLIRGLVGQGAVPASFANTMLDELRAIANTPTADARKPLIAKLATDATALSGPAGTLLAAGASGLS